MAYKTILTVVTRADLAPLTLAGAADIARAQDGHLDVLALGVDRIQPGFSYLGAGEVLMQVAYERAEAETRDLEKVVKAALVAQSPGLRTGVEAAVVQSGLLGEMVAQAASFADLVVLPRPYGHDQGPEAVAVVEAALFEGRAPVMILPEGGLASAMPKRVVVAWNQSREAMNAARRALPFLAAADFVDIVVVDPPIHGYERSDPGGALCQMLVRHGVRAKISVLAKSLPRVSDVLARHAFDVNADLLVMGAYGHSRLREAILGGATRNMLEQTGIPVLMAH
jgi:nucleotide-binding universal stress UspA family protein